MTRQFLFILGLLVFTAFMQSCGPRLSSEAGEYLSQSEEVPECLTSFTHTTSMTVNAVAQFYKRSTLPVIQDNKIKNMILADPLEDPLPIPYAEIAIYDQNKKLIQCGRTDVDGNLKSLADDALTIPTTAQSYTIRVYARSNFTMPNKGFQAEAAVKEDIYTNKVYYLETTFSSDGTNISPIELTAYARQTDDLAIKGGAFNIYNNFIQTYTFLDDNITTVSDNELSCLSTKFSIYWKAGFNPFQYLYPEDNPATLTNSSFYQKETDSLFITGGQIGDISLSNTDHFDDAVTVHEMGHFISDQCSLQTTGGGHDIIVRIDPRLAWHEGWADYLAGIVLKERLDFINPDLVDTFSNGAATTGDIAWSYLFNSYGFSDSVQNVGNGSGFLMDFKKPGTAPGEWQLGSLFGIPFDQINANLYPGEGHFREGAIARGLFKMSVTAATTCTSCGTAVFPAISVPFDSIWQAFDSFGGMGSNLGFASSNLFLEKLKVVVTTPTWNSTVSAVTQAEALHIFSDHNLSSTEKKYVTSISAVDHLNWVPYGHNLIQTGVCTKPTSIQARTDDPNFTGGNSDQRYSNHFYNLDTSVLSGLDSISVTFTRFNGTSTDHDILIFEEDYKFNQDANDTATRTITSDVVAANRAPAANLATTYTKTIGNLSAVLVPGKKYVLNIRAYTPNKSLSSVTQYQYSMSSNLGTLCPE